MLIVDVFKIGGKTAVYCIPNEDEVSIDINNVIIDNIGYKVLKKDVMTALSGKTSIVLLLDTTNDISVNQNLFIE